MRTAHLIIPAIVTMMLSAGEPPIPAAEQGPRQGPRPVVRLFDFADANKDGKLTREEVEQALAARRQQWRAARFEQLDANKDGVVSRDEFMHAPLPKPGAHRGRRGGPPSVDEIFARHDADGDGVITRAEIERACGQRGAQGRGRGKGGGPPWKDDRDDE